MIVLVRIYQAQSNHCRLLVNFNAAADSCKNGLVA